MTMVAMVVWAGTICVAPASDVSSFGEQDSEVPGKIAYILARETARGGDESGDVWIAKANGDEPRRLTTTGDCSSPKWSPDGKTIAFHRAGEDSKNIWTVSANGANPQQLTTSGDCRGFNWSPDGTKIAYYRHPEGRYAGSLWSYDLDGRKAARVLQDIVTSRFDAPQWSPDGKWLAFWKFEAFKGVNPEGGDESDGDLMIAICSPTGQNKRIVAREADELLWRFTFSPDGKRLYFAQEVAPSGWRIRYIEVSHPSRVHSVFSQNEWGRTLHVRFISEKELACDVDSHSAESRRHGVVVVDVHTGKSRTEVAPAQLSQAWSPLFIEGGAAVWWHVEASWAQGRLLRPPMLALVVKGQIVKTMEGTEVSWVP